MTVSSFADVAYLYKQSATTTISRHRIEHPTLGKFCVSLDGFASVLGESASDEYWLKFLIPLKRLRFELCATPFSQKDKHNHIYTVVKEVQYHLRFCSKLYPDMALRTSTILSHLIESLNEDKNPLLDKLVKLTKVEHKVAWVIKESRLIPHVEKVAGEFNFPELSILHPLQLKGVTCYDQLIVVGPSRWFPESIFTAARSSQVDILIFDWIKDRWKPQKLFVNSHKSSGPSNMKYMTIEEHETSSRWNEIDAESLLDIVDKSLSKVILFNNENQDDYENENVEAICIFFEDDSAVFIEANEGAKTLVIDPDENTNYRINRILAKNIQIDTFILVRTSGGGDYIVPMADKLMGKQAQKARECQNHWKQSLRTSVRMRGLIETCIDLLDFGSQIANEVNVRNWMSPRSIRTQNYNDFLAIMKLIDLNDKAKEYWDIMGQIVEAHRKAGFQIRELLLERVRNISMGELQKQGKIDFKLSDGDEGGLTAFRVESIFPKTVQVPYSRIGHPFKLEK